ncbi:hypothetical protein Y032_0025g1109 [Ancylostoma ceylanicum]|uniref:Uncharacterized protein n=1 Tax=Ancylostoma ceylanicum TaxID=53326 RepID=A0A016UW67_9BILA|nr:hypothetical protein Y032_0025g1109 [Ancylostoma ceylanicum]
MFIGSRGPTRMHGCGLPGRTWRQTGERWSDGNWRDLRNEPQFFNRGYFGGDTVMVWSGFCPNGGLGVTFILT